MTDTIERIILVDYKSERIDNESSNEMELLSQHNNSYPHSYLVVNHDHKIHPLTLFRRMGKVELASEALHLEQLNDMFPDKFDFTKDEADRIKLKQCRTKGLFNHEYEKNQLLKAIVNNSNNVS